MSKSHWSANAANGATGIRYELRTVADFLKVPEDRRCICLREFHAWLYMQEAVPDLLVAASESLGGGFTRDDIRLREADVFAWVDDGKATISVEFHDESASREEQGRT